MIVKRVAAAVAAVAMIVAAFAIRSSQDQPAPVAEPVVTAATSTTVTNQVGADDPIVCTPELATVCFQAAAHVEATSGESVAIAIVDVDATLADPGNAPAIWVTLTPLPEALQVADPTIAYTSTAVAESPLALLVSAERADLLTTNCGAVVDWQCLGDHAGRPWTELGGENSWSTIRPGLSPSSTAIGAVSITAAVRAYFGPMSITGADPAFIAWGRQLSGAVSASTLSTGTAVGTIQVRPSTLDIAVGSPAELARADDPRFAVVRVGDDISLTVVVATSDGFAAPPAFVDALRDELIDGGWNPATGVNTPFSGGDVIAALAAWKDVQ